MFVNFFSKNLRSTQIFFHCKKKWLFKGELFCASSITFFNFVKILKKNNSECLKTCRHWLRRKVLEWHSKIFNSSQCFRFSIPKRRNHHKTTINVGNKTSMKSSSKFSYASRAQSKDKQVHELIWTEVCEWSIWYKNFCVFFELRLLFDGTVRNKSDKHRNYRGIPQIRFVSPLCWLRESA